MSVRFRWRPARQTEKSNIKVSFNFGRYAVFPRPNEFVEHHQIGFKVSANRQRNYGWRWHDWRSLIFILNAIKEIAFSIRLRWVMVIALDMARVTYAVWMLICVCVCTYHTSVGGDLVNDAMCFVGNWNHRMTQMRKLMQWFCQNTWLP